MGKEEYRFKFSSLMSNSWFYKLKELRNRGSRECGAESTQNSMKKSQIPRTEQFNSIPNQRTNRPSYYTPSAERAEKKNKKKQSSSSSVPTVLDCRKQSSSSVVLSSIEEDLLEVDFISPPLPPILTTPKSTRRSPPGSQRIKVRIKSPKLARKMTQKRGGLGKSFVVVKSSSDPEKDFRESMEEMIVENNLCSLKELEELLACYLALNSTEYHNLIVKVFKQIWFDLPEFILKSY